jgi:hypothetical protein
MIINLEEKNHCQTNVKDNLEKQEKQIWRNKYFRFNLAVQKVTFLDSKLRSPTTEIQLESNAWRMLHKH